MKVFHQATAIAHRLLMSSLRRHWPKLFGSSKDTASTGLLRARQIQAVLRLAPLTMLANGLNALMIFAIAWPTTNRWLLTLWVFAVATIVTRGIRLWWPIRRRAARRSASARAMRRSALHAGSLALLWSVIPLMVLPSSQAPLQLLITAIITGMMCAGGFALATTPWAATTYVAILGTALASGLILAGFPLAAPLSCLILIYACIVVASVWSTAKLFAAQFMAESEAERQNEVINLLLKDFEENASDLLWEIDRNGYFRHASARLAALFSVSVGEMDQINVLSHLTTTIPGRIAVGEQLIAVRQHLESKRAFRDLPLTTRLNAQEQWWSLAAKPIFDNEGQFAGWRGVAADVTEAHRSKQKLTWLAHFDPLTGIANRHHFRSEVAQLLNHLNTTSSFALLCLDLDHFKNVNDTLGHAVGDLLLKEVALRISGSIRPSDLAARLGGDEFAVLLNSRVGADEVIQTTSRILKSFEAPCEIHGLKIPVRTSIGVVIAPGDGNDVDTLLNHADLALYAAKAQGRGTFKLFTSCIAQQSRRRLLVEKELVDAIDRNEMSLHFQPQESCTTRAVMGFEALLRWTHPSLGMISPAEFIPIAEDSGLINKIGTWVLNAACCQAVLWPETTSVSVNVSSVQAMSGNLKAMVESALRLSGLKSNRLQLEITESVFLNETEATISALTSLREKGIKIALDDFGTGYSSLSYLRRFPFDTIKIDRAFISGLATSRELRAIVRMIIGLGQTLNIQTVAEGVEDGAQLGILSRYGCTAIQGFYLAKPMPASAVLAYLQRQQSGNRQPSEASSSTDMMPL